MKYTVKDLGVLLSNDLTYNSHIQMIVNKVKIVGSWTTSSTFKTREHVDIMEITCDSPLRLLLATIVYHQKDF